MTRPVGGVVSVAIACMVTPGCGGSIAPTRDAGADVDPVPVPDSGVPRCPSRGNGQAARASVSFGAPTEIALPNDVSGQSVAIGDVTGDGRPDVVINHFGWFAIGVYPQLATGGLGPERRFMSSYGNGGPDRLAVGDIDGDGRPDVVVADTKISVSLQQ